MLMTCRCKKNRPGTPYTPDQCHECWLDGNKRLWAAKLFVLGKVPTVPTARPGGKSMQEKCPYLGDEVKDASGERLQRECASCGGGKTRLFVFQCKHSAREDQVTYQDCRACDYRPRDTSKAIPLIIVNRLSPGDVLCTTAAIHSLHKHHPGKFLTAVETTCGAVWEYNPDVIPLEEAKSLSAMVIDLNPPHNPTNLINQCNQRAVHVLERDCDHLENVLKVRVPLLTNRPRIWLSNKEKSWMSQVQELLPNVRKFWIVNAGTKLDYPAKYYPHYQRVVDMLHGKVVFVQVGKTEHVHPPLRGAINLIGKTDDRMLIRLVYHAQGVLCGTTFLMHLAAAFDKPAVILAGGREPRTWNQYPAQTLLSTVGTMDCCRHGGCWKSRVVSLGDGDEKDKSLCANPAMTEPPTAGCLASTTPEEVAAAVSRYL